MDTTWSTDLACSVVIPSYRASEFLPRAVRSVLRQTVADWELVIVADDGLDYAAPLRAVGLDDPRFRFCSTGRVGAGAGTARNLGVSAASARVVMTLDADDGLHEQALERLVPLALEHGAAYSDVRIVRDATGEPLESLDRVVGSGRVGLEEILTSNIHTYACVAFDRARVHARWLDENIGWEDLWFFAACFDELDAIYHLAEPLYEYRRRRGSTTTERGAAEYFLSSATRLRTGLESGEDLGIRSIAVRDIMVRYLRGREFLEARYIQEQSAGRYDEFLDFVADHREQFYRLDSWTSSPM